MYLPFITKRKSKPEKTLYRRKGGGGGGRGGGSSGGAGKSGGGSKGGTSGSAGSGRPAGSISSGGTSKSASAYGKGGGAVTTIAAGQLFAGRSVGGGARGEVYGNRQYGSGYPGITGRGVAGRPFPFFFWPVIWAGAAASGGGAYLHNSEYGRWDNSSRPGGILMTAAFPSSSSQSTTLRLMADNQTVTTLIQDIVANCSSNINSPSTITASQYNDSLAAPKPEQAIQYYRASSVALTLDGYNDTASLEPDGTPDTSLPTNIDMALLNCMNLTIGAAVPLVSGASLRWAAPPSMGLVGLAYVFWSLSSLI